MKQRVLDYLEGFAQGADNPKYNHSMMSALCEDTGLSPEQATEQSRKVLGHMLHNYGDVSISTIDQFVHRIIRSFAHELGLNPEFAIHMDVDEAVESGVDYLLEKVGLEADVTEKLSRFVDANVDSESTFNIRNELLKFGKRAVFSEAGIESLERLKNFGPDHTERVRKALLESVQDFYFQLRQIGQEALDIYESMEEAQSAVNSNVMGFFRKIVASIIPEHDVTARNAANEGSVLKKANLKGADSDTQTKSATMADLCGRAIQLLDNSGPINALHERLLSELYNSATAAELRLSVDETNKMENRLSIGDFNKIINRVVTENPTPFIYERIGERYAHFLIDEFQDVSVLQWHNFLPLLENSLARGMTSLVVGDAKQSIYRWRNGDFRQFSAIPRIPGSEKSPQLAQIEQTLIRNATPKPKDRDTNYRSGRHITDFNNRLYQTLERSENPYLAQVYSESSQKFVVHPLDGYVRIDIAAKVPKEEEEDEENQLSEAWKQWMDERIEECLADGFTPGDIALLFYKNKEGAEAAEHLTSRGMSVQTNESLMLNKSATCQLLMNTLAWWNNRSDTVAGLVACESFLRIKFPMSESHAILSKHLINKPGKRQGTPNPESLFREMGIEVDQLSLNYTSVYEWAENAVRVFGLQPTSDAYTEALLNNLASLAGKGITQPETCVQWWIDEQEKLSLDLKENPDAIRILTVHKSKGLQFPVVMMPLLSQRPEGEHLWVSHDKLPFGLPAAMLSYGKWMESTELANEYADQRRLVAVDEMNILYVATTRAMSRLCIRLNAGGKSTSSAFLRNALKTEFGNTSDFFEYGERQRIADRTSNRLSTEAQSGMPSWTWRDRIRLHLRSKSFAISENPQVKEGNLIHSLFAQIQKGTWQKTLENLLINGDVSPETGLAVTEKMRQISAMPEVKKWLTSENVMAERELICSDGVVLRPDCVVKMGNETHVIDLKTGARRLEHRKQVATYVEQLKAMNSKSAVRGFLLYTDDFTIEEIMEN